MERSGVAVVMEKKAQENQKKRHRSAIEMLQKGFRRFSLSSELLKLPQSSQYCMKKEQKFEEISVRRGLRRKSTMQACDFEAPRMHCWISFVNTRLTNSKNRFWNVIFFVIKAHFNFKRGEKVHTGVSASPAPNPLSCPSAEKLLLSIKTTCSWSERRSPAYTKKASLPFKQKHTFVAFRG